MQCWPHYPIPFTGPCNVIAFDQFSHGTAISLAQGVIGHLWASAAIRIVAVPPCIRWDDHSAVWEAR
jgi:hypothetical protein